MPYLIALLGLLGAAVFWYYRLRQSGEMLSDLANAANDVRAAARRFGFRRQTNIHPAESLEDPRIAAIGVALAVAQTDGRLTQAEFDALRRGAVELFDVGADEAEEMIALARWIVDQCATSDNAIYRLTRRIRVLAGVDVRSDLLAICRATATADAGKLGEGEADAIAQVERQMHA